jgi:anti-sigma B factor antagonist
MHRLRITSSPRTGQQYICADSLQASLQDPGTTVGRAREAGSAGDRHPIRDRAYDSSDRPVQADMLERRVPEPRFSMEPVEACVVVTVAGELDVTSSQQFDECLSEAGSSSDRMILDLSGVDFMDTSALAVIVGHWRRQVEVDGMFLLAGARYRYTKALWITGLADRLPMYDSVDEALTAARADPGGDAAKGGAYGSAGPDATAG